MKCKSCGKGIAKKSKVCPHCGNVAEQSKIKAVIISIVAALAVVMVASMVLGMVSCSNKEDPIETSLELGYKYLEEGRYEEAILEFDKVLKIDEKNTEAIIGTADAYIGLGEFNTAASFMEECIGKDKENTELYNKLVDMYTNNGDYENANRIIELARENGYECVTEYDKILEGDFTSVAGVYGYPETDYWFELFPTGLRWEVNYDEITYAAENIKKENDGSYSWFVTCYDGGELINTTMCKVYPMGVEATDQNGNIIETDISKIRCWLEDGNESSDPYCTIANRISKTIYDNQKINTEPFECIGKTKDELVNMYGPIDEETYYNGGKLYRHRNMDYWLFYDVWEDSSYNFEVTDDVSNHHKCYGIYVSPDDIITGSEEGMYTADELAKLFGPYEKSFSDMDEIWVYSYQYNGHNIYFESCYGFENCIGSAYYRIK